MSRYALLWSASFARTNPFGSDSLVALSKWSDIISSKHYAVLLPGAAHMSKTECSLLISQSNGGIILTISYLEINPESFEASIILWICFKPSTFFKILAGIKSS